MVYKVINYIFGSFFIIGIVYSFVIGKDISIELINSANDAISIIMSMLPVMCLWLGIMNIAKCSGLIDKFAKFLEPLLKVIFPEIPKNSKCFGYIGTNIIMNMLGLGNAATPFGLKAIKEMQTMNNNSDIASRSMITFLIINTAAVTIMPTTIIGLRILHGSVNPLNIIPSIIITSFLSCIIGLIIDRFFHTVMK